MYQETIDSLKKMQTRAQHIKKLGDILNKTEDQKLKQLIKPLINGIQAVLAHPKTIGKTIPVALFDEGDNVIVNLKTYCAQFVAVQKPEWQVLAERHGWTPPTTKPE